MGQPSANPTDTGITGSWLSKDRIARFGLDVIPQKCRVLPSKTDEWNYTLTYVK
jgi:hypothetical protein